MVEQVLTFLIGVHICRAAGPKVTDKVIYFSRAMVYKAKPRVTLQMKEKDYIFGQTARETDKPHNGQVTFHIRNHILLSRIRTRSIANLVGLCFCKNDKGIMV